eukprot:CAMPEP_0119013660 /NCGR_PEP_ID=MMETSP1176-20130426/8697_1 /TAXON_ID=265551 /ORGANISM="Synedropsis recta cf, Strain CCMP1620" /LENGTH=466 /DNA_ID=CAMNT_0006966765 /DNA_START=187 /DNA_END=1587 /DNA_ORIENTATION=+
MEERANTGSAALQESFHLLALRRAIVVASASTDAMLQDLGIWNVKRYVELSREHLQLQISLKSTEEAIIMKMGTDMKREEEVLLCYHLMDTDGEANISVLELAEGLRKLNDFNAIQETISLAEHTIRHYAGDTGGLLSPDMFESFFENTCKHLSCTFHELCQLCVSKIAFGQDGREILEDMVAHVNHEDVTHEDFDHEVVRARLVLIFQMMDSDQSGRVPFKEVVKHLFRFTSSADWDVGSNASVLLMMEKVNDRSQDVDEFLDFMLNFSAAVAGSVSFHDLANAMTFFSCRRDVTDQDIKELFIDDGKRFSALDADEAGFEDVVAYGKLHRLFQLMDEDNSGSLDHCELALGMRKFTSGNDDMSKSMEECMAAIQAVDDDGDGLLDVREFAKLIAKFANKAQVEVHHLIDFMVVQASMKCNSEQEEAYLQAYRALKAPVKRRSSFLVAVQNVWFGTATASAVAAT